MRALNLLLFCGLSACVASTPSGNNPTNTTGTTSYTTPTPTQPGTTTVPLGSNYGSLMLVRKENQQGLPPTVELAGIFPTNDPGFYNLAQCALIAGTCLPQIPDTEDDYIDIDPEREFDALQFDYSFAGTDVGLGPLRAWYQNGQVPHYYANLTPDYAIEDFDGTYGVDIGGEWGDYEGWDDLIVSPSMNVMSHFAGQNIGFHDGQTVIFEWEPRGEGDVFLSMNADNGVLSRMWLLEDDGYFELDVDDLMLGYDEVEMKISLQRWNYNSLDLQGNKLDVASISEVAFNGTYFYVGGRDGMIAADTCGDTNTMDEYLTGQYWGRLADWGYTNALDSGWQGGCTGYQTGGAEGLVKFDLPPRTFLSMAYTLLEDDASLYLVTDCNDVDSCIVGADDFVLGEEESLTYFNNTDEDQTVYGVLDGFSTTNGLFYADISVTTMGPADMHDTCADAQNQLLPTPAGGYYDDVTAYTNQLDPAQGACTPNPATGPDAMTKIELQPNETIQVNVDMQGADPVLYLLNNCQSTTACAAGNDSSLGPIESVNYQNTGATPETLFLVVDSKTSLQPYFMVIDIY